MIRTILAFFGYVKIPKEVIVLSISVEDFVAKVSRQAKSDTDRAKIYMDYINEASKTLTKFLRSGRLISYNKGE